MAKHKHPVNEEDLLSMIGDIGTIQQVCDHGRTAYVRWNDGTGAWMVYARGHWDLESCNTAVDPGVALETGYQGW